MLKKSMNELIFLRKDLCEGKHVAQVENFVSLYLLAGWDGGKEVKWMIVLPKMAIWPFAVAGVGVGVKWTLHAKHRWILLGYHLVY